MPFFGVPIRNGLPIGLGSVAGFGVQQFDPSLLFEGGTVPGAWYDPSDLTTMFDTSAGTTPVAMPGQGAPVPVGLMLDKSQNGVGTNGAKRVNLLTYSEEFDNGAWNASSLRQLQITPNTTIAPNGTLTANKAVEAAAAAGSVTQRIIFLDNTASAQKTLSIYAKKSERKRIYLFVNGPDDGGWFDLDLGTCGAATDYPGGTVSIMPASNGWFQCFLTPSGASGGSFIQVMVIRDTATTLDQRVGDGTSGVFIWGADLRLASEANTQPTYQRITDTWYSTLPGNHAIAFNNTTARPELRARVNLLTYSEEFDNGAWGKIGTTVTPNTAVAPDGTTTADSWFINSGVAITTAAVGLFTSTSNAVLSGGPVTLAATSYTYAFCVKTGNGLTHVQLRAANFSNLNGASYGAIVRLSDGNIVAVDAGATATVISLSNGWFKIAVTFPATAASWYFGVWAWNDTSITANGTEHILLWGADLRPANIGANVPAYQRIADANTYDTSGFPLYLLFEGAVGQRGMYTPANLNLSATDKVGVFAGVRKLSDAATGVVAELSATIASNNGTFLLAAPDGATQTYGWDSKGTTQVDAVASSLAAPRTNVLVGTADIAGDSCIIRVNGAVADTEAGNQGTGNFGTYPLFIGARNNASLWFNGHLYSLAVVGSVVSAGNIAAMESWVAGRTGIQI